MIEVRIKKDEYQPITDIDVVGHANYGVKGEDIVCSAVSILWYTLNESMKRLAYNTTVEEPSETRSLFIGEDTRSKTLISSFILGITSLEQSYPLNVKVILL